MLAAGCSARPADSFHATVQTCYAFAVQALQRHITVTTVPRACAGLSHEQIDQVISRAIHEAAVGPKVAARRRAAQDSRYLTHLFHIVPPPGTAPAPEAGAPAKHSAGMTVRLAALAAWVVTAAAGAYLLASWLRHGGPRRRRTRTARTPPAIAVSHAALAVAGLGIWLAFAVSDVSALGWTAAGLILPIVGLGMATLVASLPGPAARPGAATGPTSTGPASTRPASQSPAPQTPAAAAAPAANARTPVLVIALHGVLATATILLVLLAAISS